MILKLKSSWQEEEIEEVIPGWLVAKRDRRRRRRSIILAESMVNACAVERVKEITGDSRAEESVCLKSWDENLV